mgnify:CR=1 FL=1|tara:strand:+ start:830 stop:1120 length:291 start_codon:yes stop_codon:yes gene_type:complete
MGDADISFTVRGVLQTWQRGELNIGASLATLGRIAEKFNRYKRWISYCGIDKTISDKMIEDNCLVRSKEISNPKKFLASQFACFATGQPITANGPT